MLHPRLSCGEHRSLVGRTCSWPCFLRGVPRSVSRWRLWPRLCRRSRTPLSPPFWSLMGTHGDIHRGFWYLKAWRRRWLHFQVRTSCRAADCQTFSTVSGDRAAAPATIDVVGDRQLGRQVATGLIAPHRAPGSRDSAPPWRRCRTRAWRIPNAGPKIGRTCADQSRPSLISAPAGACHVCAKPSACELILLHRRLLGFVQTALQISTHFAEPRPDLRQFGGEATFFYSLKVDAASSF